MMYDRLEDHQVSSSRVQQSVQYGLNTLKDFISQAANESKSLAKMGVDIDNPHENADDYDDNAHNEDIDGGDDDEDSVVRGYVKTLDLGDQERKDDDDESSSSLA